MTEKKASPIDPQRSELMKRVRQKDTSAEQAVQQTLRGIGARFRTNVKDLPGRPDIVNKTRKKAIFVHGCYWHAHLGCHRFRLPKHNREFWAEKFAANILRDIRKAQQLADRGFDVRVVWECELERPQELEQGLRTFWFEELEQSAGQPGVTSRED